MQIKTVRPINFMFYPTETRLSEIAQHLPIAPQLIKEAGMLDLWVTGPVHWHYRGFTGDPDALFHLEIALPVATIPPDYDGRFHFKRSESFRCVAVIHEGPWVAMSHTYAKLIAFAAEAGLIPSGTSRELYINVDFQDEEANTTEIQLGVN